MGKRIFTQWPQAYNEKATYIGPVFKGGNESIRRGDSQHVFVTVGTRLEPFVRLLRGVEELARKGVIKERVVVQAGHTGFRSDYVDVFDFCHRERIDDLIVNASYVITQESAGIGTQCLRYKRPFIVVPREYRFGEVPAQDDMKEDLHYRLQELGYTKVVRNVEELAIAIGEIPNLKVGFPFNNSLAIAMLRKAVEEV
jgi:UDP-N-acetylglucosamine transferase subunit ALG13